VKKIIMLSILATSLMAAPAVQAQMRHGPRMGFHGSRALGPGHGGWFGNHGHMQAPRFQHRNHGFAPRGFSGHRYNNRNARNWAWGRGQHRGFAQNQRPRGWNRNHYRGPYQARGYANYRQPYRPAAYGPRPGFNRGHQAAFGPGYHNRQNYHRYNDSANTYRPGTGNYNHQRPNFSNPGITQTAATSSSPLGHRTGTWSHGSNQASGGTWSGHTNTRFTSGTTPQGAATAVATD
jgi:hypothetical protein